MELKRRYCSHCGDKTNDIRCEVCGRATKPVAERFKETELNLVDDDIKTEKMQSNDFYGDIGEKESIQYHNEEKKHPSLYEKNSFHNSNKAPVDAEKIIKYCRIIGIIVMVAIVLFSILLK